MQIDIINIGTPVIIVAPRPIHPSAMPIRSSNVECRLSSQATKKACATSRLAQVASSNALPVTRPKGPSPVLSKEQFSPWSA